MRLTPAQKRILKRTAEEGSCRIDDDRQHKTRTALIDHGLLCWNNVVGGWILSRRGAELCQKLWPDSEPVELGNPFSGERCGLPQSVLDAMEAVRKANVLFDEETAEVFEERQRREKLAEQALCGLVPFDIAPTATRTIYTDGQKTRVGYEIEVGVRADKAPAPSQDRFRFRRGAFVTSHEELERFAAILTGLLRANLQTVAPLRAPDSTPPNAEEP